MATKTSQIRNLTFVGGADAGKTTLADAFLFKAGASSRLGRVDDGTSLSDFTDEEKKKKHSLSCSILHGDHKGCDVTVIDTPGYPDYVGEAIPALYATETTVLCINAYAGVVLNARKLWERATELGRARIIVITKLDHENIEWDSLISNIKESLGDACTPLFASIGTGTSLTQVIDCFDGVDKAEGDAKGAASEIRAQLIESLVEDDEGVMERYLEGEEISHDELQTLMTKAMISGTFVPVLCCSVEKDIGVNEVLDFICEYAPSPSQGPFYELVDEESKTLINPEETQDFSGYVFRAVSDPFIQKASFVRVVSGEFSTDTHAENHRTQKTEKITTILRPNGREYVGIEKAIAGQIVAIPKLETLLISDTLTSGQLKGAFPAITVPVPMVGRAVEPKSHNDEQKIGMALRRLSEDDPTFVLERDATTHELIVHGISNLHLDTIFEKLKDRFHVEVTTKPPKIPYKETITTSAKAVYRHKKQTGGAGQFAEVHLRVEPRERGLGYEYSSEVFGGSISGPFQQSIDKGIQPLLETGVIAGYPVVDVKAVVFDGKEHPVDSKDIAFQVAGRNAFREAFRSAKPVLLEPIAIMEITVPSQFLGEISGDLNTRRGKIQGMDSVGSEQVIRAQVPLSEIQSYAQDLRSMTAGEGSFTMEISHYDPVPTRLAQEIMSKFKSKDDDE